jgi:transposase-like protein
MVGGDIQNKKHAAMTTRKHVVELRDGGASYPEIARQLRVSVGTAWNHYQQAMRDEPAEAIARHRANQEQRLVEQLNRIDMERDVIAELALRPHLLFDIKGQVILYKGVPYTDCKPVMDAIKLMIQLDDQEAKLMGLYAAHKVQADVQVNFTVTVPESMQKALT